MSLHEYKCAVALAIALKDQLGLSILYTEFLVDDCGVVRKITRPQ
jgi:hypothetical protein